MVFLFDLEMVLKKLHMGTISFGSDSMSEIVNHLKKSIQELHNEQDTFSFSRKRGIANRVLDIVVALAICHNVTPTWDDDGRLSYQASSPDEIAIVQWTELMGLSLIFRDPTLIRLKTDSGTIFEFEILDIFPFTSELKRMGIVLKNKSTGQIMFYQKGADVIMSKIVMYNHWLDEECGNMAREGLRTLVIGRKHMTEERYIEFKQRYEEAKISLNNRQELMQSVVQKYLEKDLELLGLTGVEDKLQDDIKISFELLRNAGLKIWMLTGDKIETAKCISLSSKLISKNQSTHVISQLSNPEDAMEQIDVLDAHHDYCLIIDGQSLQVMLKYYADSFIRVAVRLPVVVCCRCSPTQKADVVRLVNTFTGKRTCAIGDGGNDVSMIQTAHVGIGIVGKEGKQASLAADFSITQFSHITRLLLWHGRNSYKRSAKLAHFVIHRGLIISVIQAVFSALFYYAPIAIYQGMILVGYCVVI